MPRGGPRSRRTRSPAELKAASENVLYAIEMLNHTAQLLYEHPGAHSDYWVDKTVYFAMVESFAAHARELMDFFHPPGTARGNDILATDFIPGWSAPPSWSSFADDRTRVGREIMHLSYARTTPSSGWAYGELVGNLNVMIEAFVRDVNRANVMYGFKKRARSALTSPLAGWTSPPTETSRSMTRLGERRGAQPLGAGTARRRRRS